MSEEHTKITDTTPAQDRDAFIKSLENLVAELKAGRELQVGIVFAAMSVDDERLPDTLSPERREEILADAENMTQQVFTAVGEEDKIFFCLGEMTHSMGEAQTKKHREECHDPECEVTDQQAMCLPALKVMTAIMTRAMLDPAYDSQFLLKFLKDGMARTAAMAVLKNGSKNIKDLMEAVAANESDDNVKMIAVEGDEARAFMRALLENAPDALPDELKELIRNDMEEHGETAEKVELGANTTLVKGDRKIKH